MVSTAFGPIELLCCLCVITYQELFVSVIPFLAGFVRPLDRLFFPEETTLANFSLICQGFTSFAVTESIAQIAQWN